MRKKSTSQFGIFNPRTLTAVALFSGASVLFMLSSAAAPSNRKATPSKQTNTSLQRTVAPASPVTPDAPTPSGGTLSPSSGPLTFTDATPLVPNPTGEGVGFSKPTCTAPNTCSIYTLTLDPSLFVAAGSYDPTKNLIVIQISWATSANQYGSFVEDKNGNVIASNTAGIDPETISIPIPTAGLAAGSPYTIVTTAEIGGGDTLTGVIRLVPISGGGTVSASPAPRYQIYPSTIPPSATNGLEPSIGVDWNPNQASLKQTAPGNSSHGPTLRNTGGIVMFTETFNQDQVNFDDCSSPAINTWTNVAFPTEAVVTSDAIGFTDHFTTAALGTSYPPPPTPGRLFHGQLAGGDSITAFSDDDGGVNGTAPGDWTPSQGGGVPQGPDHETIGGGPYNPNSTPPPPPHPTYVNAIYYCTQNIVGEAECSRSDNGGLTFGPAIPIFNPQQCLGGTTGHVKVARDGTVYVAANSCALPGAQQGVAVSLDNGITWTEHNVPGSGSPKPGLVDPSVGIGLNDVGKAPGQTANRIYLGYIDSDGTAKISVSGDKGQTWSPAQNVGATFNLVNTTFPVVVAGDDNRAAFGFLGTTTAGNSSTDANFPGFWHLYIATTYDGGNSWTTIDATPNDPVQVGPVCNGGTFCTTPRNLLDFNGFDVDSQGRGVLSFADGCVNCTNSSKPADSTADQATVARQSGGPRLFKQFDPVEPSPPANPQAVSAVKGASGVLVSWLEPDNGGDPAVYPITGYNVYRSTSTGTETFLAHVTNSPTNKHTKYLDTAIDPTVANYFYHVAAVNNIGESGFCQELSIGSIACPLGGSPCAAPFTTVNCAGGAGNVPTDPTMGELTIQNVSIGEPFTSCTDNSLTFVMRVQTLDPAGTGMTVLPPNSGWQIIFNVIAKDATTGNPVTETVFVEVDTFRTDVPSAVRLGRRDPTPTGTQDTTVCSNTPTTTCPQISATETKDGTITIKLNVASPLDFPAPATPATGVHFTWDASKPGTKLSSVGGNAYFLAGAFLETVQTTGVTGSYTRVGNISCSNKSPIAILSGSPRSGNAPLAVTFDASASNEPTGACGTINSYTLDFGDGSAAVTQSSPNFSHTYNNPGEYPARLTVGDTAGLTSTNPAEIIITVNSAGPPVLSSVKSRMIHGNNVGAKDIDLPLTGPPGVECRTSATTGNFTMVFNFANELKSVDDATITTGAAQVHDSAIGSDKHQYFVNLTGVTNAQLVTVALVNAHDSIDKIGNVFGTMGVLLGDVNGDGFVLSGDYTLVRQNSGAPVGDSNFKFDVNTDGFILSGDYTIVRSQSGNHLP